MINKEGLPVICECCGTTKKLEYHHRIYRSEGGSDESDNIMVLCYSCHRQIHQQNGDFKTWGAIGGNTTNNKYGNEYYSLLAKIGNLSKRSTLSAKAEVRQLRRELKQLKKAI